MINALYCRSTAVLLAIHVWLYVVAVLYSCTWPRVQPASVQWLDRPLTARHGLAARPTTRRLASPVESQGEMASPPVGSQSAAAEEAGGKVATVPAATRLTAAPGDQPPLPLAGSAVAFLKKLVSSADSCMPLSRRDCDWRIGHDAVSPGGGGRRCPEGSCSRAPSGSPGP